jgi:hypothetical protein
VAVGAGVEVGTAVDVRVAVGSGVAVGVEVGGSSVGVKVRVGVGEGGTGVGVRVGGSTSSVVGVSVGSATTRERPSSNVSTVVRRMMPRTTLTTTRPMATWRRREEPDPSPRPVSLLAMPIVP